MFYSCKQFQRVLSILLSVLFLFMLSSCGETWNEGTNAEESAVEETKAEESSLDEAKVEESAPDKTDVSETDREEAAVKISAADEKYILRALDEVGLTWEQSFAKRAEQGCSTDRTFNIIHTRLIKIKDNDDKYFSDVEAVVEFVILSDYAGSAPYYINAHRDNSVVFYKDGRTELRELFAIRRASTYKADCSDIIDEVIDLGTAYNSQSNPSAPDPESAAYVQDAINVLQAKWRSNFATWNFEMRNRRQSDSASSDGTLKILNTRLLYVDSNTANQELYEEYFKDVKVIVEFELYSDDYGSAPYYVNVARDNAVWIMEDGSVQMGRFTIFELLRKLGSYDFSTFGDLFTRIIDLGSACNETFTLLT